MRFLLLVIISSLFLGGCGKSQKKMEDPSAVVLTNAHQVQVQPLGGQTDFDFDRSPVLIEISRDTLKNRLESAMKSKLRDLSQSPSGIVFSGGVSPLDPGLDTNASDFTAFDGKYWFIGSSDDAVYSQNVKPGIDIWSVDEFSKSASQVSFVPFEDAGGPAQVVGALHLVGEYSNRQLLVRKQRSLVNVQSSFFLEKLSLPAPNNLSMRFEWLDIDTLVDKGEIKELARLDLDGQFLTSVRKGNTLYVVSRYWAWLHGLNSGSEPDSWFEHSQLENYLPTYSAKGAESKSLIQGCLSLDAEQAKTTNLVNITAIDLNTHKVVSNRCVQADPDGIYATDTHLYLGFSRPTIETYELQGRTEIHQFVLDDAITYRASGSVPGLVKWGEANIGLTELGDNLYVASTQRDSSWKPVHNVFKLHVFGDQLMYSGLGKDDLYAELLNGGELLEARFVGGRVYLIPKDVSAAVDVVGLREGSAPSLLGSIAPGSYGASGDSHVRWLALGSNQLLSIANVVNEDFLYDGLVLTLIDASNVDSPKVVDTLVFDGQGTYSESVDDLRGLSVKTGLNGDIQIVLPVSVYGSTGEGSAFSTWRYSAVNLVDVQLATSMSLVGQLKVDEASGVASNYSTWAFRGLFHANTPFYYFNGQVFGGL